MNIDAMRQRFHVLGAERTAVSRQSYPVKIVRDALKERIAVLERACKPLTDAIKDIEDPLFEIDQERARIARALSGKTGLPPATEIGTPLMKDAEIADLLRTMKINEAVAIPVASGAAQAEPDTRVDELVKSVADLRAQIASMPAPVADQSGAMSTLYADMKNFAAAVLKHDEKITEIAADNARIASALNDFYAQLKAS